VELTAPAQTLRLKLYSQALVRVLTQEQPGNYQIGWNDLVFDGGTDLGPGLYFGRIGAVGSVNDPDSVSPVFRLLWVR
jgi:hypothetical protein